jgi:hypothetical protein
MGVATKKERPTGAEHETEMSQVIVAKDEDSIGCPRDESRNEGWVVESAKMMGARIRGSIGDELVGVACEQVAVPRERCAELRITLGGDAEIPEVKYSQINRSVSGEPREPRTVVLRGVRKDDGKAW